MYEGSEYIVTMIFNHRYRYFVCGVVLNLNNSFTLQKKKKKTLFNKTYLIENVAHGQRNYQMINCQELHSKTIF